MGQRISRSDLGLQRASCLEPKRRTCAGQYSSSHRCAPAGHLRADGNYSQVRLRTAAACADGARSTAVARRDGRSHKRPGGTSTKLLASVTFDPSVGAIGVDLAASLGQHAPRPVDRRPFCTLWATRTTAARGPSSTKSLFGRDTRAEQRPRELAATTNTMRSLHLSAHGAVSE